jgi:aldehyde:ferredoxin oxidoreductase
LSSFGYAGKILKVDLNTGKSSQLLTGDYRDRFLGGRGLAAKLYWDLVPSPSRALGPDNCLICATGPVTGFFGLAGCRWTICGNSPAHEPEAFSYGNLGGKWGSALKSAGYDALAVQGKADAPVYLFIHDGLAEVKDASDLWGQSTFDTADSIHEQLGKEVSILSVGPAAENQVIFATALADRGASVSGGLGAVMGSKNLKAIAVTGSKKPVPADPERLRQLVAHIQQLKSRTYEGFTLGGVPGLSVRESCYGCGIGCPRESYPGEKGRRYKTFCQSSGVYAKPVRDYYGKWHETQLLATRLCDGYGLDTVVMGPLILWLMDCYTEGILSEENTGLPLSRIGSPEFIETLTRKIATKEGFGQILAQGTLQAAGSLGSRALDIAYRYIVCQTNENRGYDPRLITTTALMYATEPRMPIQQLHSVSGNTLINWVNWARGLPGSFLTTDDLREISARFWGSALGADFSTLEGKALAAKTAQDRVYVQESLILCDLHWPTMMTSAESAHHVGDPSLESQVYSAITGAEMDEAGLLKIGERIFNLQRAIQLRQGWGGRQGDQILDYFFQEPLKKGQVFFNPDCIMPGKDGEIISLLGKTWDRQEFEKMKDDYYRMRGWDVATGIPTKAKLEELGLEN